MPSPRFVFLLAGLALASRGFVHAQDNGAAGEPIDRTIDPAALTYDILVDGNLAADDPAAKKFKTLQAAYAAAPAGTAEKPTVIGLKPNVYLIPGQGAVTGLTITKNYLTLLGLTNNRRSVVLADNRGNRMGGGDGSNAGGGNGYVVMVNATGFTAKNLTFLNYCNVDYEYPGDPAKNLAKRSATITQAVALDAVGDRHHYENVAFCSRLDTTFIRCTRSYFKNVFIEGTDDFIGGGQVGYWENCEIVFPTGSGVCAAGGIAFVHCKFSATQGMQFSKGAGRGVALIDCTMPDSVAWVRAKAPPRPNVLYFTYRTHDAKGRPAKIADGSSGPATYEYARELSAEEVRAFNPWNMLRAAPNGTVDDWDPANARAKYEASGEGSLVFRMAVTGSPASVRTGSPAAMLTASVQPARVADKSIKWSSDSKLVTLLNDPSGKVTVTGNNDGLPAWVPIVATAANGHRITAWVFVEPRYVDPPQLARAPALRGPSDGKFTVDYAYPLEGREDQSQIVWLAADDAKGSNPHLIAVNRGTQPLKTYALTAGDVGKFIYATVAPKHNVSEAGPNVGAPAIGPIAARDVASSAVTPNFRDFVVMPEFNYVSGRWTLLGQWNVVEGENFVNGYGIRAASQGAQLLYQNDAKVGDMQLDLVMSPEKTEGMGFGSPGGPEDGDRVQKSDIFIKYDPRTKTGYALRYWRTTESARKCRYQLYRIAHGVGTPLDERQAFTGVFKPNTTMTLRIAGDTFTVRARNDVDDETLFLEGKITPNDFGGAGVAWYGTVPRGNSNVYSRFDLSYPPR